MSNTKEKAQGTRPKAKVKATGGAARRALPTLLLFPLSLFLFACRMDMQDQPRYEVYEPSKSYADGISSRPLVEGTVPRGYLREDTYFYTGQGGAGGATTGGAAGSATGGNATGGGAAGARDAGGM